MAHLNTKDDYSEEKSTKKFHVRVKQIVLDLHINVRRFHNSKNTYSYFISGHKRIKRKPIIQRSRRDSNLRGETPMDF